MKIHLLRPVAVLAVLSLGACAVHETYSFRGATIFIDRGISIPVPPPSLSDAPVQETEVVGDVDFEIAGSPAAPATLHLHDQVSGVTANTSVTQPQDVFMFSGIVVDHSDNCLELWLEADGDRTPTVLYHTVIAADDQSVEVVDGCP